MDNRKTVDKPVGNGASERLSDVKCVFLNKTIYRTYVDFVDFVTNFRPQRFERGMRSEIGDRSHVYSKRGADSISKTNSMVGGLIHVRLTLDTPLGTKSDLYVRNVTLYRTTP